MDSATQARPARYYTAGQIAAMCSTSRGVVMRWIDDGLLKGHRLAATGSRPGRRRVSPAHLLAFLRAHEMPVPAELEIAR